MSRPFGRRDLYIAAAVFVIAWIGCRLYLPAFRSGGGRAQSYFDQFGPAVMEACGHGFANPSTHALPSLEAFLVGGAETFDCRALGERPAVEPLNAFQSVTRNLLHAAAATWRLTGVSWNALDSLAAAMFSITLTTTYVTVRFVLGQWFAVFATLVWAMSPMHLSNIAHLRDYSKAPFFLFTALAMALAIRIQRPTMLVMLGAVFGVAQGFGLGMRTDVGLNFVPFFLVLFTLGSGGLRTNVSWKTAAAAVALASYVLVAWPVLTTYTQSEGLWHVSLLGLTTPFDDPLNIRKAPYDFGYLYNDSYMSTVVQAYWNRMHDAAQLSLHDTGLYDKACRAYYGLLVSTFPADFLTRMAGSALHVVNLPFTISYGIVPLGVANTFLTWAAKLRASVMLMLTGMGPIAAAYLLMLIGIRDRIAAAVALVVLAFWATYPYLQFHERHVFHLEILTIVVLLWAAQLSWAWFAAVRAGASSGHEMKRALQSSAVIAAFVCAFVVCLAVARVVQAPRTRMLFEQYESAADESLDVRSVTDGETIRLSPTLFEAAGRRDRVQQAMLALSATDACNVGEITIHVRYSGDLSSVSDFSRDMTLRVAGGEGSSRVFLPVYSIETADGRVSRFASIDVVERAATCVQVARARHVEHLPLMLDASLPLNWQSAPMYERLYLGPLMPERVWLRVARWWPRVAQLG